MLFLSYAKEDGETAQEIAEWFRRQHIDVYLWQDPQHQGKRFINQIELAMKQADAFVALLSPSFIASAWCRRESEVAIRREEVTIGKRSHCLLHPCAEDPRCALP